MNFQSARAAALSITSSAPTARLTEPALEPGLRARPDGVGQEVPGAQRGR